MTLAQKHRYEVLASNLIYLGTLVFTTINFFVKQGFWGPHTSRTGLALIIVISLFILWVAYLIRKGRKWAKLVYILITIIGILPLLLDFKRFASISLTSTSVTVNFIAQEVLYVGISTFLLLSLRKPTPEPLSVASE